MPKLSPNKTKFNFVLWIVSKHSTSQHLTSINSHLAICTLVNYYLECMYGHRFRSQEGYHIVWRYLWLRGEGGNYLRLGPPWLQEVGRVLFVHSHLPCSWKSPRKSWLQSTQIVPDTDRYVLRVVSNMLLSSYLFCILCDFLQLLVGKKHPVGCRDFWVPQVI